MRKLALAVTLLSLGGMPLAGCDHPPDPPSAVEHAPLAYRGDAIVVGLITESAARHEVPRDLLLALGWAETRLVSRSGELAPGAHETDEAHEGLPGACGLFGLDEGAARDEAAALIGVDPAVLCEYPELEADAAAARLRRLAGGERAPAQDDLRAWLAALDAWHPALAEVGFPYRDHLAEVMNLGFRGEDELGDVIYLPPVDGVTAPMSVDDTVGLAEAYARPDTPLAEWQGPACDYQNASRGRGDIRYVVIHTCEGGFAGCVSTVRSCGGSVVSAHYVTSYTGYTAQIVEEQDIAWHVGCLNGSSIGIEHEGYAGSTMHPDAQMCRSARIVRSICDRYGIPCDRSRIIGHVEANSMFCHGSHWDPGPHWNWTRFMEMVRDDGCDCRPTAESCNGRDDDCDRRTDEGVTNACGTCGAAPAEACNGRDDDCDGTVDDSDVCEIDLLHAQPAAYAPPVSTDIDGDRRSDLCARGYGGVRCWPASASGWGTGWDAIPWSDTSGWDDVDNYATIRMGDVNGDGRADVCARANASFLCALSTGTGFSAHTVWRDGISDANGWNHPRFYTTLRLADVNADGTADLCARDSEGFGCWLSNGTAFESRIEGPRWSDASGWGSAQYYGTIRMADLNGDDRADVCARGAAGVECFLSDGEGFPTRVAGPAWSNDNGWGVMQYWSTIRLIDFDGDGLADLCARSSADLSCLPGSGTGFGDPVVVGALSDASGWNDRSNYATLRTGDVNGDGADDLCVRSNTEVLCYAWDGAAFVGTPGPGWSDDGSWNQERYHQTMRLADFDGDGDADVCARAGAGWRCHPSADGAFGDAVTFDELTDAGGWIEHRYWSTIQSAGRACIAVDEMCNGEDDDCDGEVDEHATVETCNLVDDDCDGEVDEELTCGPDAGVLPDGGAVLPGRDGGARADGGGGGGEIGGSCSCRTAGSGARAPWLALGVLALALAGRMRRTMR